jgi:hypothetical protein
MVDTANLNTKNMQYPCTNMSRIPNAIPSTELHRSETELFDMCRIFLYTQDNLNVVLEVI